MPGFPCVVIRSFQGVGPRPPLHLSAHAECLGAPRIPAAPAVDTRYAWVKQRAAVAKAKADFVTAKAAAEAADVEAKTLRLEADGLIKPAPTADTY